MERFADKLRAKEMNSVFIDPKWIIFVKDHRDNLIDNSTTINIEPETMFEYQYRPEDYLASINYPIMYTWIILWLNQIESNMEFKRIPHLILPNASYIQKLSEQYRTYLAMN